MELLRQDPDVGPVLAGGRRGDHLVARDARSLARLLLNASGLEEAHQLIDSAQENLAHHGDQEDDEDEEDLDHEDDRDRD